MAPRAESQHYVPQFYLRQFASHLSRRPEKCHIYCFDIRTGTSDKRKIKNVACADDFYEWTEQSNAQSLEGAFSTLESKFAPAFRAVSQSRSLNTLMDYREGIAYFIATQMLRTASFRKIQGLYWERMNEVDMKRGEPVIPYTDNLGKIAQARFIQQYAGPTARILLAKSWVTVHNATALSFWTSDNPVVMYLRDPAILDATVGINLPSSRIYVPISPKQGLILCDPAEISSYQSHLLTVDSQVDAFNRQQVYWADQMVFSHQGDFTVAHEMLERWPDLAEASRVRAARMASGY